MKTMTDLAPLLRLALVRDLLLACDHPDLVRHAEDLDCFLSNACPSLDDACSVYRNRGQHDIRVALRREARNQLIRETAHRFFPGASRFAQSRELAERFERYFCGEWQRTKTHDACPYEPDCLRAALWEALRFIDQPLKQHAIQNILRDEDRVAR
jgi:hypothetical protein